MTPRALLERMYANQSAVARAMGIHQSYLSHLLAGRRRWTPELRRRFAQVVNVPESEIDFADGFTDTGNGVA